MKRISDQVTRRGNIVAERSTFRPPRRESKKNRELSRGKTRKKKRRGKVSWGQAEWGDRRKKNVAAFMIL